VPGEVLFGSDVPYRTVSMSMPDHSRQSLNQNSDFWVEADLTIEGLGTFESVGIKLKGNGSFRPLGDKAAFKIETDRFVDDQLVDGIDEFVLNNMVGDPTMLAERLAYEVYEDAGVPVTRAVHATLAVNEVAHGLYTLVESVDGRFLERWFDDAEGPLYEMFDVDFAMESVELFDHDGGCDDRSVLYSVAAALSTGERLTEAAGHLIDIDDFATYFAVSAYIGQFDAYPYSFPGDDVYLYVDPSDGKIRFIPHGADETFADPDRPVDYVFGHLGTACLEDPECEAMWRAEIARLSDGTWEADYAGVLDEWSTALLGPMRDDPMKPYTISDTRAAQDAAVDFIDDRPARLEHMLGF